MKFIGIALLSFAVFRYLFSKGKEYDKMPNVLKGQIKTLTKISDLVRFRNMTKEEIMCEIDCTGLEDFFADFGKSDTESELARIELYKKDLDDKLEDFSKDCKNKSKLCKNMSFLASLFIIVIFF